jgi:predicted ATPase
MLAVAAATDGEMVVPPTLQVLLGARLDQLEPAERRALERAAVEGEVFHLGAVQALSPDEASVTPRLAALVRRGLIGPSSRRSRARTAFVSATCSSAMPPTTPFPRRHGPTCIAGSPSG